MMLLNNDYYLDAKSMIMSTEINELIENTDLLKDVLKTHIEDKKLHGTDPVIIQNITQVISGESEGSFTYYNSDSLKNDLIIYLPINYTASKLNQIISEVPHNLNSHNVVFLFVIPEKFNPETNENGVKEYILNIENDSILFSHFYNGTIFVVGDFLQKTKYFSEASEKNDFKIEDPIKNDGINIKRYINNLFNEIDESEDIDDLVKYENDETIEGEKTFNKIIIEGSSLNENYSLLTFNDINANVYVKNLKFRNSLKTEHINSNYIEQLNINYDILPSDEKFLLMYPIENDLKPIIGTSFSNYLNKELNIPIISKLDEYIKCILSGCEILSSKFSDTETDGLIYYLKNHNVYDFEMSNIKEQYLINDLVVKLTNINSLVSGIVANQPSTNYNDYLNTNGEFVVDEVKGILNNYLFYVNNYLKSTEEFFNDVTFINFLKDRHDLVSPDLIFDSSQLLDEYKKLYFNDAVKLLNDGYTLIRDEILYSLFGLYDFSDLFKLKQNGNIKQDVFIKKSENSGIKSNYIDGSIKCFELCSNNNNIENGYFSIESKYTELITKLMFNTNTWSELDLKNRFEESNGTELTISNYDTTLCFWRKNKNFPLDEVTYISFQFDEKTTCDFNIKAYSIENIGNSLNPDEKTYVAFNQEDLYTNYNGDWQFWCIKISNQYVFNELNKKKGKLGLTCDVFVNVIDNGKYTVKKYSLIGEANFYNVQSPLYNNEESWKNSKIYIGYSKFNESLNINKNYFNGYFRNVMLFAGHLTDSECRGLFNAGIQPSYKFSSEYVNESLNELFESRQFFIGLIGVYNVSNINILNCIMKYNGKYLKDKR